MSNNRSIRNEEVYIQDILDPVIRYWTIQRDIL